MEKGQESKQKRKTPLNTIAISQEYAQKLDGYLNGTGITRKEFVELSVDYFQRTGFDLRGEAFDLSPLEKVTGRLEQSAKIMEQANEGTEAVRQLLQAVKEQTAIQKQLPAPDLLQKATNRVAELEHLIGKYQEKLDSLSEDKTMIIKERVEWERKYYERDKQNYALLDTLKKQGELLEKAKTELRHCKGFFSSANEDVLKELGIS